MNRRELLWSTGLACARPPALAVGVRRSAGLPCAKSDFLVGGACYLDAGAVHPLSQGGKAALDRYLLYRTGAPDRPADMGVDEALVRAQFARLINADAAEIAFVQSTTAGENLILQALGLPAPGQHVVTDTLHFFGSMSAYLELEKAGVEVTWLQPKQALEMLSGRFERVRA